MNRSIFHKIFKLILLIVFVILINNLYEKHIACMGYLDKISKFTYNLVIHAEKEQKYTNLGVPLETYDQIIKDFSLNSDKLYYRIVSLPNPNQQNVLFRNYYSHYFLQIGYPNCKHFINYPFTHSPFMYDDYIRFIIEYKNGIKKSQCLTSNGTVINVEDNYYILSALNESLSIINDKFDLSKTFKMLTNSKKY